ncbi:MAG TPA: hypothetical protein VFY68_18000, partial [Nitrososphaeraceae archaeon]|nr:hypothetical protein [Nitrososphaeraceae archaeon]
LSTNLVIRLTKMHNAALEMRFIEYRETDMNTRFDIYSDYTPEVESSHFLYLFITTDSWF